MKPLIPVTKLCNVISVMAQNVSNLSRYIPPKLKRSNKNSRKEAIAALQPNADGMQEIRKGLSALLLKISGGVLDLTKIDYEKSGKNAKSKSQQPASENLKEFERRFVGAISHQFTHIDQTLLVEHVKVKCSNQSKYTALQEQKSKQNLRWLTKEQLKTSAISKSVIKCFELISGESLDTKQASDSTPTKKRQRESSNNSIEKDNKSPSTKKKKKETEPPSDPKQQKITAFAKKSDVASNSNKLSSTSSNLSPKRNDPDQNTNGKEKKIVDLD